MPEEHLAIKAPETAEEKAVRTEQELADDLEENRGILPKALRNVLIIMGSLLVVTAAVYVVILRMPVGKKEPTQIVIPTPAPSEEIPAAVSEGRIARVLGASTGSITLRAHAEMFNDKIIITRPVGVIPHPYLQSRYMAGYSAIATRTISGADTVFNVTANLPILDDSQSYSIFVGPENTPAQKIGTMIGMGLGTYTMSASMTGYVTDPFVFVVGPDPGNKTAEITILSGAFQSI